MIQSAISLTKQRTDVKIKISKCSSNLLWYNKHIGEEFEVKFMADNCYWAREKDGVFNCLNWIHREDATITEGNVE